MPLPDSGRFKVRVLAEMLPLKMLPVVPVAKVVTTLVLREIWVEVPIKAPCPPLLKDRPVPTDRVPKVVVLMPPLAMPMTPLMPMVEVPVMAMLVPLVNREPMSE